MCQATALKVRPMQTVEEEGCSEGTSSALGISAMSGLEEKGEGEQAEGSERGGQPGCQFPQGLLQRKRHLKLQQASQPLIFLNPVLADDLFLLQAFSVISGMRS